MVSAREMLGKLMEPLRNSAAANYYKQARNWIAPRYQELRARYYKLDMRERRLLQLAGAILILFLGYNLIYLPITSYQSGLEDEVAARQRDLAEVREMTVAYRRVKTELTRLEKNTAPSKTDFSISSTLSTALNGAVEADKIGGISTQPDKPISDQFTQYTAVLRLTNISLAQLVDVLYRIKSLSVPVVVSNLNIKKHGQDAHAYDVDMSCSVLGKNA
jgi:type II secretory pathway component PulM